MNSVRIALVALLAAVPVLAHSFDFKGVQLGKPATPEEIRDKLHVACGEGYRETQVCNGPTTIGQEPVQMNLVISPRGVVQRIYLWLAPDAFEIVAPLLSEKFGPPTATQRELVQNRMGAKFEQIVYTWRRRGGLELTYERYAGDLDTSFISFRTSEDRQFLQRSSNERKRDM